jgi:periplasmic divalent cation tolerance protein
MPYIIVIITATSRREADLIANSLVDSRIAACVNILPGVKSVYTWKGKKEVSRELMLIVKTKKDKFIELKKAVKSLHSYEVPEIISVEIDDGEEKYLNWIKEAVRDA